MIDIRRAKWYEDEPILEIERMAFPPRLRWTMEDLRSEIDQDRVLVCEKNGIIVGYAAINTKEAVGLLNSVAVSPHYQGGGYGSLLVERAIYELTKPDIECVELDCDASLHDFYARLGFEKCGEYTTGVGAKQIKRVVMRYDLRPGARKDQRAGI